MPKGPVPSPAEVGVRVGDFFVCSWGYDQTNIDFYKVVGLTPKGVKVQEWTSAVVGEAGGPSESVVPGEGPATYFDHTPLTATQVRGERPKPLMLKRLRTFGSSVSFTVNSYSTASKWDGAAAHKTGSGWGH